MPWSSRHLPAASEVPQGQLTDEDAMAALSLQPDEAGAARGPLPTYDVWSQEQALIQRYEQLVDSIMEDNTLSNDLQAAVSYMQTSIPIFGSQSRKTLVCLRVYVLKFVDAMASST